MAEKLDELVGHRKLASQPFSALIRLAENLDEALLGLFALAGVVPGLGEGLDVAQGGTHLFEGEPAWLHPADDQDLRDVGLGIEPEAAVGATRGSQQGFVNALAILIFLAQIPYLIGVPFLVYPMIAAGLAIMVGLRKVTRAVPAPLVAIVALTGFTVLAALTVPNVGDEGELPDSLPALFVPNVPISLDTLQIIAPYALAMALVGLLESLLTAKLVDDVTDTHSEKTREAWGQGASNIISTFLAGVFLLILVVGFGAVVAIISMAALVAVMIMVAVATFDWHSVQPATLRRMPKSETTVMLSTVVVVVATHNLAIGVGVGVLVAMALFARRVAHLTQTHRELIEDRDGNVTALYRVTGELFFASSNDLYTQFEYADDPDTVVIDLTASHIWDASIVASLDAISTKYARKGKGVEIVGLDATSATRHQRLSGQLPSH